jgi:transposase-like protein
MPDPEQIMDIYRQTGTITAVAEHFGVPRHTVAGWTRRLRSQGHTIGRA